MSFLCLIIFFLSDTAQSSVHSLLWRCVSVCATVCGSLILKLGQERLCVSTQGLGFYHEDNMELEGRWVIYRGAGSFLDSTSELLKLWPGDKRELVLEVLTECIPDILTKVLG